MMNLTQLSEDLSTHAALCEELLFMTQTESQELASARAESFQFTQRRKTLLPRLDDCVGRLREHRSRWLHFDAAVRQQNEQINSALCRNQQLIMKVVALDRDNEQARLRRGLLPVSQVPSLNRERPHFVVELYRRYAKT